MGANAPDGSREGQGSEDDLHGLTVFTLPNQSYIGVGVDIIGTSIGTGGAISFVDPVSTRDGLSVRFVCGLPGAGTRIELTGHGYRANLSAITATGALIQLNVARLFPHSYLETARLP